MNERNRKLIHSPDEIPPFSSEDEEREWWATHELSAELYDESDPNLQKTQRFLDEQRKRSDIIEIEVVGLPPVYGAAQSIFSPKHPHKDRVVALREAAERVMKARSPLRSPVSLIVDQTYAAGGMADGSNIVGAIGNALEGIVYENDRLIREMHYFSTSGRQSMYRIIVRPLDGEEP